MVTIITINFLFSLSSRYIFKYSIKLLQLAERDVLLNPTLVGDVLKNRLAKDSFKEIFLNIN